MKKTFTAFIVLLHFINICYAQNNILERKVQITGKNKTIETILKEVTEKYDINISYNSKQIPQNKQVDFSSDDITLSKLLDKIFIDTDIVYYESGNHIILKRKSEQTYTNTKSQKSTISGYIKDASNGEVLIGANVFIAENMVGTVTNVYGFYSITIPQGQYTLSISYLGYNDKSVPVNLTQNIRLDTELELISKKIEDVIVTGEKLNTNITNNQMGTVKMSSRTIQDIPVLMGEADVIKAIKLLPGVQPTGETSSGMSVRGGARDQNLILLDEAPVYNASHLLGFFSVFNNDAIKNVDFMKGNVPARYGGRLASILDIRMKDGNMKKFEANGGLGLIASRLTLEGPIVKDKASFLLSGRRTYFELFTAMSNQEAVRNSALYFYDLNAKINLIINPNNRIYISGYYGKDVFTGLGQEMSWGNHTHTVRWNHLFSEKLFSNFSFFYTDYKYGILQNQKIELKDETKTMEFVWDANMKDYSTKIDFGYFLNTNNTLRTGAISTFHEYDPGKVRVQFDTIDEKLSIPNLYSIDHALFIENEQKIGKQISLSYGIRYSIFQNIGKATFYPVDKNFNVTDTIQYSKKEIYNTYTGLEPRLGITFVINEKNSIKTVYNRSRQYVQIASNSTSGMPLDVWIPAGPNIKPQIADLVSLGYFRNFFDNKFETSIEAYYKYMQNQVDFRDHASLLLNDQIEKELRYGWGQAYGVEFYVRKNEGKFNGWISYTLSKSERKITGINNDKMFLSPYDRPHNLNIVCNYNISKRLQISANWVYLSGNAFTTPSGKFDYGNMTIPVYTSRNSDRMPDYHRLDLGITLNSKEKPGKRWKSSWNLSVYNVYNKKNAAIVYFDTNPNTNTTQAKMMYIMPVIPTITYNFKF